MGCGLYLGFRVLVGFGVWLYRVSGSEFSVAKTKTCGCNMDGGSGFRGFGAWGLGLRLRV